MRSRRLCQWRKSATVDKSSNRINIELGRRDVVLQNLLRSL